MCLKLFIQKAYYYYIDFFCKSFPIYRPSFKEFIDIIIEATPFLRILHVSGNQILRNFDNYQTKIPRYGCIILNPPRTKILLIVNKEGKKYSFPKGKINSKESPVECAIRETFEEIGVNVSLYVKSRNCILHETYDNRINGYFIADGVSENV